MRGGASPKGEDVYVAPAARSSGPTSPWYRPPFNARQKFSLLVALVVLCGGAVVGSLAVYTSTLTDGPDYFTIANYYLQDSTTGGNNASTLQTFTGGTVLWAGPNDVLASGAAQVHYIGVFYQNASSQTATITLTLADDGGAHDGDMDIKVEAGTCSTGAAANMPATNVSTATADGDCTGSNTFTPLTTGGTPIANGTFAANNGTTANLDNCPTIPASGACGSNVTAWAPGNEVVYQITATPTATITNAYAYTEVITWTATV